jgi:hypothetical protein
MDKKADKVKSKGTAVLEKEAEDWGNVRRNGPG